MSRRSKTLHDVWDLATSLNESKNKKQLVRWNDLDLPADRDYSKILDRPCLVETVEDWDKKHLTSVSHSFATVNNINDEGFPVLQFYNQSGDKDELLEEQSVEDIYLFPASGSRVTLADNNEYFLGQVNLGSLTFKVDKLIKTRPRTSTKKTAVKSVSKDTPKTPVQRRKRKPPYEDASKTSKNHGNHVFKKSSFAHVCIHCLFTDKKSKTEKKRTVKKKDCDEGSSSSLEGSDEFTLDRVMRSFENPRGEYA